MEATVSRAEYEAAIRQKQGQIDALRHELAELKRLIFGAKSERFVPATAAAAAKQMALWPPQVDPEEPVEPAKERISYQRRKTKAKPHPGRTPLPEHLPVRQVRVEPTGQDTSTLVEIGQDITRKVDYIPGKLEVIEYIRPRYVRPAANASQHEEVQHAEGSAVIQAPAPDQVLPKAIAGAGLLTQLAIAKFIDHLPLYRQRAMFRRDYDWDIPSSTLGDWFAATCTLLEPLYAALEQQVLDTDYLQGDESRITVLERGAEPTKNKSHRYPPKSRKVHLGYMWVFRNPVAGGVLFAYRPGRGANILHETLDSFGGILQSDGYSAYTSFMKAHPGVVLVSCLAHIRRKFFDARSNHPELAELALHAIQYLYRIEDICRRYGLGSERRRQLRQRYARPAYTALLEWVNEQRRTNLSKGGIGKALNYAYNHLPRLGAYLDDGHIEIDNNLIENKIRPLALGRKNYLFAGSRQGAQRAAMLYSFFGSCREAGVNEREWLHDVLLRIGSHPINRIEELLPGRWKANV
ncbi:IS66 family transposase [Neolewinella sp.]|uniref:IS66 family transposase n=1 Tax=Neolewinella sp. TaxID=2993543 RepID=UPI003B523591